MRTPLVLAALLASSPVLAQGPASRGAAPASTTPASAGAATTTPAAGAGAGATSASTAPGTTAPAVDARVRASRDAGLAVREAVDAIRAGNLTYASSALDRAEAIDPGRADVPYYVAVVRRREQRNEDAIASFRASIDRAARTEDTYFGLRARVGVAETLERIEGRLEEARSAWGQVVEYVGAHPSPLATPEADVARERASILGARLESDQRYAEVKARIAAREAAAQHSAHPARHGSHP